MGPSDECLMNATIWLFSISTKHYLFAFHRDPSLKKKLKIHTRGVGKVPLYQINHLHKSPKLVGLDIIIWFGIEFDGVRQIDRWVHVM